jgi:hypothetical protein
MKQVIQLDNQGYFVGFTTAEESPLEPGVFLIPGGAIDVEAPSIISGKIARWDNQWIYEDVIVPEEETQPEPEELTYTQKRALEYPLFTEYLDGIVKGDQAQIDKYIADCLAVKAKYPKPE